VFVKTRRLAGGLARRPGVDSNLHYVLEISLVKPAFAIFLALVLSLFTAPARAGVGDPQLRTDHPWYPGELACSTFERLFATEAELYERVVGIKPKTDEQKVLAAWLWRNTHYWHGEEGAEDLWGQGFTRGLDLRARDYWTGL